MTAPVGERPRQRMGSEVAGGGVAVPAVVRQRNVPWMIIGALVVAGSALLFALYTQDLGSRDPALVVAESVPAGQRIRSSDLKEVKVALDPGVRGIAASNRGEIVGQIAAIDLVPGTLLNRDHIGAPISLGADQASVPMVLKPGQISQAARVGDRVMVVDTGTKSGEGQGQVRVLVANSRIAALKQPDKRASSQTILLSIVVPKDVAPAVAGAAAEGRIYIVHVPAT